MKILISTGIYPPKIGGPSQYAFNLKKEFEKVGHIVKVATYGIEEKLPTGIRHIFFLFKAVPVVFHSDIVFVLDTMSVGLPTVLACKMLGKGCVIRTGGDFLWEQYVERTKKKILLRNFYQTEVQTLSFKENIIFRLTAWTLNNASKVIFSTEWQKEIFVKAYKLEKSKTSIIENFYGPKESDKNADSKLFLASARNIFLKNLNVLQNIFNSQEVKEKGGRLFGGVIPFDELMDKMRCCYAVLSVSVSEISPNIIMDAIRLNRPFICTKEVGIFDRVKEAGIFVDPLNEEDIKKAVLHLLTEDGYAEAKRKVMSFNFTHTWPEIAKEFLSIGCNLK